MRRAHAQETGITLELRLRVNTERSLNSKHTHSPVNTKQDRLRERILAGWPRPQPRSTFTTLSPRDVSCRVVSSQLLLCTGCLEQEHEHEHKRNKNWRGHVTR